MDLTLNNQWTRNADAILKYAIEQTDKGNPFPIFATCLGHQLLSYLTSNYNDSILTRVHGD
jgi:GMP synthase-like glutamine amidotransferase